MLLAAWGSAGDVVPLIALGTELESRGHRVTLIAMPVFEAAARRAKLSFAPVGSEGVYEKLSSPHFWSFEKPLSREARDFLTNEIPPVRIDQYYDAIRARDEPGRTVIVMQDRATGAHLAHERLGIPLATVHLSPIALWSRYYVSHPPCPVPGWLRRTGNSGKRWAHRYLRFRQAMASWLLDAAYPNPVVDAAVARQVARFQANLGPLPERRRVQPSRRTLAAWPEWFAPPHPDAPPNVLHTGFLLPASEVAGPEAESASALSASESPIVFTTGSVAGSQDDFYATAIEACTMLDRPGLLVTRYADQIPQPLPAGITHVEYAPFGVLLPMATAVVHHGGIGTIAHALAAGVPQVSKPMARDQFDNSDRMERLGVGRMLDTKRIRARQLADILQEVVTSDEVRARCAHWSAQCDLEKGRVQAADSVEELMLHSR